MFPQIPWYRIEAQIGEGGMSKVYRAKDLRSHNYVAIKQMEMRNTHSIDLFKREANHYVYLRHPRLMQLIDFAEQGDSLFLIMELIQGESLHHRLHHKTGPMVTERAIPLFLQVLETIGYLHSQDILHLDIKPANIMVQEDDSIKIIDMGISANLNNIDNYVKRTGTPAYMSPEQLDRQELGFYTDIWALGVMLFKMLTCQEPFVGHSREDLNNQIRYKQLPRAADFYPGVSSSMQLILGKALNKNPYNRYRSCADFAGELRYYLETGKCYTDT